jgi:hypothetical protein
MHTALATFHKRPRPRAATLIHLRLTPDQLQAPARRGGRLITTPMGDTGKAVRITTRPATIARDENVLLATVASSIS